MCSLQVHDYELIDLREQIYHFKILGTKLIYKLADKKLGIRKKRINVPVVKLLIVHFSSTVLSKTLVSKPSLIKTQVR